VEERYKLVIVEPENISDINPLKSEPWDVIISADDEYASHYRIDLPSGQQLWIGVSSASRDEPIIAVGLKEGEEEE